MQPQPTDTPFIAWCTVLETSAHDRASVVGGGGGGFSYEGTGFTHVNSIRTVHEQLSEFWVRYDNGNEDRLNFRNIDVPARAGHRLALLFRGNNILAVRNANTGLRTNIVGGADYAGPKPSLGCSSILAWSAIAAVALLFAAFKLSPYLATIGAGTALQTEGNAFFAIWNPISVLLAGVAANVVFHRWCMRRYRVRFDRAQSFLDHWVRQLDEAGIPGPSAIAPTLTGE